MNYSKEFKRLAKEIEKVQDQINELEMKKWSLENQYSSLQTELDREIDRQVQEDLIRTYGDL